MLRRLRIATSSLFFFIGLAICVLWARSYEWEDTFLFQPVGIIRVAGTSDSGRVAFGVVSTKEAGPSPSLFQSFHSHVDDWLQDRARIDRRFSCIAGFGGVRDADVSMLMTPSWFVVLLTGLLSFFSWPQRPFRFSLRAMLIAMTFLAIVLGMIAWLDRA